VPFDPGKLVATRILSNASDVSRGQGQGVRTQRNRRDWKIVHQFYFLVACALREKCFQKRFAALLLL
jgi:hypothetical protein